MKSKYLLTISNKNLYKEIEIPQNAKKLTIGTANNCDIRLKKDDFFEPVNFLLVNENGVWQMGCAENLYIDDGSVAKLLVKRLTHGAEFEVKYQSSDQQVFRIMFQLNFARKSNNYDSYVDVNGVSRIAFGDFAGCDFMLKSVYTKNTEVVFSQLADGLILKKISAPYGVYINGRKAKEGDVVKSTDFFSIADCFFYYKGQKIWLEEENEVDVINLKVRKHKIPNDYPKFTRNTRIKTVIDDEKIEILDPPQKPQKPKDNLVIRLLPSLGMLLAAGIMVKFGGYMIIFAAISGVMAIITTVATIIENKRQYKKDSKERIEKYNAYIDKKRNEIKEARDKEKEDLEEIYISTEKELLRFRDFSPSLFDRQKTDDDFLCVRLGEGKIDALKKISYKKQERLEIEDDLQNMPLRLSEEYKGVEPAPVICNLAKESAIGICGNVSFRYEFFKKMLMDIVARQYYADVRIAFVASQKNMEWINSFRFIPHLLNPISGQRNIVCDEDSKNQLFEYLYNELTSRKAAKSYDYNIVVFFVDEFGFKNHPVSRFMEKANELGVSFVFFEERQDKLPQGCSYLIAPTEGGSEGILIDASDKNKSIVFKYDTVTDKQMAAIARLLAPVYSEELSLEGSLTKNLTLFELLEILSAKDIDLKTRWSTSKVYKSMSAPLGVSNKGIVELDLHDSAHGPHGLVAGTTGSGKSELLLTYVLSMATLFHPYEVGFVIIDFKGGGMANQLKDLPHLIGTITNIDGKEINRSLKSIKAELKKRQRLFAEAEVNHIDKYILKYKSGEASEPLPHLIIIVDEFAELKAAQPEFMKELISAARIGRSLGVHLILATQKPAGQVDDQIWSNSRFKLCLKVQDASDSNEVLKSPLAAEIKEPGRAYLQVGNNEIFELFQSGYSGAPESTDKSSKSIQINEIKPNGQKKIVYKHKPKDSSSKTTQLDSLVSTIAKYAQNNQIAKLPPICLPPLAENIAFKEGKKPNCIGIETEIGIYDDPDNQAQLPYKINLTNENLFILGSAQSGKSNLIQSIIRDVASKYSADEVNFYLIDFASMFLKSYESLAHVGGVVTPADDEKLKNLIKLLAKEMAMRKEIFLDNGVSSYSSYLEAGKTDLPQIIVVIDNLTVLREMYFEEDDDDLITLCREGQSLGVNIIAANSSTSGLSYKYLANFSCKIALFNNDSNEYSSLFDHCREKLPDIKGRSLIEIDKEFFECQTYLAFEGEKEVDKVSAINEFIEDVNARNKVKATHIPEIPDIVNDQYLRENYRIKTSKYSLPIGLDYNTVNPVVINFARLGAPLVISGRADMGQTEFAYYVINKLRRKSVVYIVDDMTKAYEPFKDLVNYSMSYAKSFEYIKEIEATLKKRYDALSEGEDVNLEEEPLIILFLNNQDAVEAISENQEVLKAYKNIVNKYKSMNICVIINNFPNVTVNYASPEVMRMAKEAEHFLYFDDLNTLKFVDLPLGIIRANKKKLIKGDTYYMKSSELIKTKCVS